MKKLFLIMSILSFLFPPKELDAQYNSIHDFKVDALEGGTLDLGKFKGKKILIVNTASKCGLTPQYKDLEALYKKYKDKLVVVGFPANDFLSQEPGTNPEIKSFCQKNYGVSFPMAAKISVKGKKMHPLYVYLTQKKYNGFSDNSVKWNFQKYLIDEKGKLIAVFSPQTNPLSDEITSML